MRTTVRTNSAGRRGHGPVFLGENAERKQSEIGKLNSNEGAGGDVAIESLAENDRTGEIGFYIGKN